MRIGIICLGLLFGLHIDGSAQPTAILFQNGNVFDGSDLHSNWSVLVQGNEIVYAGLAEDLPETEVDHLIELEGLTLLPGLIEGHSHLFLHPYDETGWNDQVLKESFTERTVRAVNHAKATLDAGITTVRDLGTEGAEYLDVELKQSIEKGLTSGPRMIRAGRAIVATGSYGPKGFASHVKVPLGAQVADDRELVRVVREQIGHGVDVLKVYADYRWGPFGQAAPTFSVEELRSIVETAASSERMVVAHAATEEGMRRATLAGVGTIEHGDGGTPEIFELMVEHKVALCPTLAAGDAIMQYRGWKKGVDPEPDRIVQKKKSFGAALKAGVTICAGGDVGVFTHGDNVRELEMMVEYGMSDKDVLRSATSVNAQVFDLSNLGKIEHGKMADLILVEGDPTENISVLRLAKFVMKDGKIIKNELGS